MCRRIQTFLVLCSRLSEDGRGTDPLENSALFSSLTSVIRPSSLTAVIPAPNAILDPRCPTAPGVPQGPPRKGHPCPPPSQADTMESEIRSELSILRHQIYELRDRTLPQQHQRPQIEPQCVCARAVPPLQPPPHTRIDPPILVIPYLYPRSVAIPPPGSHWAHSVTPLLDRPPFFFSWFFLCICNWLSQPCTIFLGGGATQIEGQRQNKDQTGDTLAGFGGFSEDWAIIFGVLETGEF